MNFGEYRKCFANRIKWTIEQNTKIKKLSIDPDIILAAEKRVSDYERDLHIICRRLDIIKNKYPEFKNMPNTIQNELERMCLHLRFNRYDNLTEFLLSYNIK